MRTKIAILASIGLILLLLAITGCSGEKEVSPVQVAEKYINEFFSFNSDDRFTTMLEGIDKVTEEYLTEEENPPAVISFEYEDLDKEHRSYDKVYNLCTDECREASIMNRLPQKYDKAVFDDGFKATVESGEVQSSESKSDSFYYTVVISLEGGAGSKTLIAKGQLELVKDDKSGLYLIKSNSISGIVDDDGDLWPR